MYNDYFTIENRKLPVYVYEMLESTTCSTLSLVTFLKGQTTSLICSYSLKKQRPFLSKWLIHFIEYMTAISSY